VRAIGVPAIVLAPGATGLGGRPSEDTAGDQRFTNVVEHRIVEAPGTICPRSDWMRRQTRYSSS
jgi:hypothetical protein